MSAAGDILREIGARLESSQPTGPFVDHDGMGRPHPPGTFVEVVLRNGDRERDISAGIDWNWLAGRKRGGDVISYRCAGNPPPGISELAEAALVAIFEINAGQVVS